MGFFNSSVTAESSSSYNNPELRAYTEAYRGAAPWGFASLDPEATLMAMGQGTKLGGKDLGAGAKKYLEGLSKEERAMQEETTAALERIKERQASGKFLLPQEAEFINTSLDKAFEFSRKTMYTDWERGAQMLAGSRGLRMSDTPVGQPATQELRNLELGLGSKRAELGLSTTLDFSRNQQLFDQSIAQFNQNFMQNKWLNRQNFLFGAGGQMAGNLGYTTTNRTKTTSSPSGLSNVMGTMKMISTGLDLAGQLGGGISSMGAFGGAAPKPPTGNSASGGSYFA